MPRVPIPGERLQAQRTPEAQVYPIEPLRDARGAQMVQFTRAATEAGTTVMSAAAEAKNQLDAAAAREYDNAMADEIRKSVVSYEERLGKEAVQTKDEVIQDLQKRREEITQMAENPEQRLLVQRAIDQRMQDALYRIGRHASAEGHRYELGQSEVRLQGGLMDAAQAADKDAAAYAMHRGIVLQEVEELARLKGVPADLLRVDVTTKLHDAVIAQLLADGRGKDAEAWLAVNRKEIDPRTATRLQGDVKDGVDRDRQIRIADQAIAWADSRGGTTDQRASAAEGQVKIGFDSGALDGKDRDAVTDRVRRHYNEQDRIQAKDDKALLDRAHQFLYENQSKRIEDFAEFSELKGRGLIDQVLPFQENGRHVTDPETDARLSAMSITELSQIEPGRFEVDNYGKLSRPRMNEWLAKIARAKDVASTEQLQLLSDTEMRDIAYLRLHPELQSRAPTEEERSAKLMWQQEIDQKFRAWQAVRGLNKKNITDEDKQKFFDEDVLQRVTIMRGWLAPAPQTEYLGALSAEDRASAFVQLSTGRVPVSKLPAYGTPEYLALARKAVQLGRPANAETLAQLWYEAELLRYPATIPTPPAPPTPPVYNPGAMTPLTPASPEWGSVFGRTPASDAALRRSLERR